MTLETLKTVYHHNIQELSHDKATSSKLFLLLKHLSNDPKIQEIIRSEYEVETHAIKFIHDSGYSHLRVNKIIRSIALNLTSKNNVTNTCQEFLEYNFVAPIPWPNIDDFY